MKEKWKALSGRSKMWIGIGVAVFVFASVFLPLKKTQRFAEELHRMTNTVFMHVDQNFVHNWEIHDFGVHL